MEPVLKSTCPHWPLQIIQYISSTWNISLYEDHLSTETVLSWSRGWPLLSGFIVRIRKFVWNIARYLQPLLDLLSNGLKWFSIFPLESTFNAAFFPSNYVHYFDFLLHPFLETLSTILTLLHPFLVTVATIHTLLHPFLTTVSTILTLLHPFLTTEATIQVLLHPFLATIHCSHSVPFFSFQPTFSEEDIDPWEQESLRTPDWCEDPQIMALFDVSLEELVQQNSGDFLYEERPEWASYRYYMCVYVLVLYCLQWCVSMYVYTGAVLSTVVC